MKSRRAGTRFRIGRIVLNAAGAGVAGVAVGVSAPSAVEIEAAVGGVVVVADPVAVVEIATEIGIVTAIAVAGVRAGVARGALRKATESILC
ncbi:MAG: hypothetical protein AAFX94_04640 [Myxococcota bacterium]